MTLVRGSLHCKTRVDTGVIEILTKSTPKVMSGFNWKSLITATKPVRD